MSTQFRRLAALTTLGLTLAIAAGAQAACPDQPLSQPFAPCAAVRSGNESFHVAGADDANALRLPDGSSATTPPLCVGVEHPTVRFFARNTGSPLSLLAVSVRFRGIDGLLDSLPIGTVVAGRDWQPTLPMPVVANLLALTSGQEVSFRFTPVGLFGGWSIDDVYVDPYRKG
jgi:hypothetical protein